MKKILFLLTLFISSNALASKIDNNFCNQSDICKKYCQLREDNKFDDNNPQHEEMLLECSQSLYSQTEGIATKMFADVNKILNTVQTNCPVFYKIWKENKIDGKNQYHKNLLNQCLKSISLNNKTDPATLDAIKEVLKSFDSYSKLMDSQN